MKYYTLFLLLLSFTFSSIYSNNCANAVISTDTIIYLGDRKLSEEEVKKRGIDLLAAEVIESIEEIDLKKMARSAIFETTYGFRWKMFNVQTGNITIIKVNKSFKLISARNSKKSGVIIP